LVIVGGESHLEGADRGVVKELKEQADQLRVNTIFIGERSDPIPDIKGFDIGTCVSDPYNEGVPNSLIESMAVGQPVVATNVDQIFELVKDGYNGLLVPPGDAIALSQALEKLLRNPDLRASLGDNARKTIETKFSMKASVDHYRRIYQELTA
jgi:glycosyltransferase involved in cell wall biosynthesis